MDGSFNISWAGFEFLPVNRATNSTSSPYHVDGVHYIMSVLGVCGIVGHLLVLVVLPLEIKLRTVSNALIWHLSLVDLLFCLMIVTYSTFIKVGLLSCSALHKLLPILAGLSALSQLLISINRFALVTKSKDVYNRWFSVTRTATYISIMWIFEIMVVVIFYFTYSTKINHWDFCQKYPFSIKKLQQVVYICKTSVYLVIATALYSRVRRFVKALPLANSRRTTANINMTKLLWHLFFIYVICVILSPVLMIVSSYNDVGKVLHLANYAVSPFIYGFKIGLFKESVQKIFCCYLRNSVNQNKRAKVIRIQILPRNEIGDVPHST